jgi:hypothetical protein
MSRAGVAKLSGGAGRAWPAAGASGMLRVRVAGFAVAGGSLGLLLTGAALHPDPSGHGTHAQLGLPGCGFLAAWGHPCPTCGMTTAVSLAAHGRLLEGFWTQPFGFLVAVGAAVAFWCGLYVGGTGSSLGRVFGILLRPRSVWIAAGVLAASWAWTWARWPVGGQ